MQRTAGSRERAPGAPKSDGWTDRQWPAKEEVFLDHAGYFVADLTAAGQRLERLGFQVSVPNVQRVVDAQGQRIPALPVPVASCFRLAGVATYPPLAGSEQGKR